MRSSEDKEGDLAPRRLTEVEGEQGLSRNQLAVLAALASAVAVVFCCLGGLVLVSLPSGDAAVSGEAGQPSRTPTAGTVVWQTQIAEDTPSFVPTDTTTPSFVRAGTPTPSFEPTETATPELAGTVESTPTSRPTVDPAERWLQHWDKYGSTFDPEGWFRTAELAWDAVEAAVDSGDRREACGYSVLFKIEEAESALDDAPRPGQLDAAEKLLRDCIIYWRDAAVNLAWECHFTSEVPHEFGWNAALGRDALDAARLEIEEYKQAARP